VLPIPIVAVFNASLDLKWLMGAAGCADQGFSKRDGAGATCVRHAQLAQSHLAKKAAIMTVSLTAWYLQVSMCSYSSGQQQLACASYVQHFELDVHKEYCAINNQHAAYISRTE
jgi:hypothetical protein